MGDPFAILKDPLNALSISLMGLVLSVSLLALAVTGIQMLADYITGNVLAQRQHRGQLIKILTIAALFGSGAFVTSLVTSVSKSLGS